MISGFVQVPINKVTGCAMYEWHSCEDHVLLPEFTRMDEALIT